MRKLIVVIVACIGFASTISAAEPPPEIETSPAFNKLKQLIGDWKGKMTRSTGEVIELELNYKLTSNNSVIVETAMEDGVEMITTYRDRFGKLTATHYCALGNQPMFNLSTMTDTVLDFELDPLCGLKEGEHKYVKDWKVIYDPKKADVLNTEYVLINEDKSLEDSAATLRRVN